jgi:arylsulfatase
MRLPGAIAAGTVCSEPLMTIDILPTVARLIGAALPERGIDGRDAMAAICGEPGSTGVHQALYFYYSSNELRAVRAGGWKLVLPHSYQTAANMPRAAGGTPSPYGAARVEHVELYDLRDDISESRDLAAQHPDVVARLEALAQRARADLGDSLTGRRGANVRQPGRAAE